MASASTFGPVREIRDVIPATEQILRTIGMNDSDPSTGSRILWFDSELLPAVVNTRSGFHARFGNPIRIQWVGTRLVGKSLLSCIYLEKFQHAPLVWRFAWYFNGEEWAVLKADVSCDLSCLDHLMPKVE